MYSVNNVLKTIFRNKIKYIILGILIILLNIILFITLKTHEIDQIKIENIRQEYGSTVTIDISPDYLNEQVEDLTYEDYQSFGNYDYVKEVNYIQNVYVRRNEFEIENSPFDNNVSKLYTFVLICGDNNLENSSTFKLNSKKLIAGTYPNNDFEILINSTLAKNSNLGIGDILDLTYKNDNFKLEIVGLYENKEEEGVLIDNTFYMTYDTSMKLLGSDKGIKAEYVLNNWEDVEMFESDLYANGLDPAYIINNNKILVTQKSLPIYERIDDMTRFRNLSIIVFLISISIMSSIILGSKKQSMKILRILGMRRKDLFLNSILEISIALIIYYSFVLVIDALINYHFFNGTQLLSSIHSFNNILLTNIAVVFLVCFETILFIYSYEVGNVLFELNDEGGER